MKNTDKRTSWQYRRAAGPSLVAAIRLVSIVVTLCLASCSSGYLEGRPTVMFFHAGG